MPRQFSGPLSSQISPVPANYITVYLTAPIGIHEYLCRHTLGLTLMSWQSSVVGLWYATFPFHLISSKLTIMDLDCRDM